MQTKTMKMIDHCNQRLVRVDQFFLLLLLFHMSGCDDGGFIIILILPSSFLLLLLLLLTDHLSVEKLSRSKFLEMLAAPSAATHK